MPDYLVNRALILSAATTLRVRVTLEQALTWRPDLARNERILSATADGAAFRLGMKELVDRGLSGNVTVTFDGGRVEVEVEAQG